MAIYDNRICRTCGCSISGGPRAWYCPSCRQERQRASDAEYKRRVAAGTTRKLGNYDKCVVCGKEYIINGGNQKYCRDCAPPAYAETDRVLSLDYYHNNSEDINASRNPRRRVPPEGNPRECTICGATFTTRSRATICGAPECRKKRHKEYESRCQKDVERRREYMRRYTAEHKEKIAEYGARYYAEHKEEIVSKRKAARKAK